ncbi:class E sortase [Kitasatospora sp. MAP5-34]|uniref:sortase n=1 Tax=Kitasatospora sp. MAP5-34 TaxID=3035102 RepID=UPI0024769815|nr:class E sortase [Kitasatospora sp. MAP5-34]MDH6579930.1 sortase A [Kitasatospora sp. MAP5-34]
MTAPTLDPPAALGAGAPAARTGPVPRPSAPGPAAGRRPAAQAGPARRAVVRTATALTLLGLVLVGFGCYLLGVSGLQEEHFQSTAYRSFANQLAGAVAPTGTAADGAPVAVIAIPAIGLRQAVVVEGTTGRDLMRGPGHRRDTALPGQTGVSVIFGRRSTFGSPFADLAELRVGDKIYATTAQGTSSYTVNAYGDGDHPVKDPATARLVLVTGDSDWIPTRTVLIGARLDGTAQPDPGGRPGTVPTDRALASDSAGLPALQLWSLALLAAVTLLVLRGRQWWPRGAAHLVFAPVLGALLWCVYESAAALLPNLY